MCKHIHVQHKVCSMSKLLHAHCYQFVQLVLSMSSISFLHLSAGPFCDLPLHHLENWAVCQNQFVGLCWLSTFYVLGTHEVLKLRRNIPEGVLGWAWKKRRILDSKNGNTEFIGSEHHQHRDTLVFGKMNPWSTNAKSIWIYVRIFWS